jgi:beta-galactosidase
VFLLLKADIVRPQVRRVIEFNDGWSFLLSSDTTTTGKGQSKKSWRSLSLPHDWSIESDFSSSYPSTNQGGALPGGTGWYRKHFGLPSVRKGVIVRIEFDGVTFQHSAASGVHPLMRTDITVRNISVKIPLYAKNSDGIDVESCST